MMAGNVVVSFELSSFHSAFILKTGCSRSPAGTMLSKVDRRLLRNPSRTSFAAEGTIVEEASVSVNATHLLQFSRFKVFVVLDNAERVDPKIFEPKLICCDHGVPNSWIQIGYCDACARQQIFVVLSQQETLYLLSPAVRQCEIPYSHFWRHLNQDCKVAAQHPQYHGRHRRRQLQNVASVLYLAFT